ncbi:cytochrome P450, partial [Rhodofomes roseus]
VHAYPTVTKIVARASNRLFVGAPLCRNTEYLDIMRVHAANVDKAATILTLCPKYLKPLVASLFPWQRQATNRLRPFLKPILDERTSLLEEPNDASTDKPVDLLMWMMEEARRLCHPNQEDLLIHAVLAANFAAIHTTSVTFTHALYHLAAKPAYAGPLREEIERVVSEDGWTRAALGRMWRLESFLKDSCSLPVAPIRYTLQDVLLSNGTLLPEGTLVTAVMRSTHLDEANFPDAATFDPTRFSSMGGEGSKNRRHYVGTSPTDIGFGHGRHACPGRFFAADELKIMLACVVMRYDVKFREEGKRPDNEWFAYVCYPAQDAQVLFRKRRVA